MLRVTKTGGVCAAREGDLETEIMWPPLLGMLKFHHEYVLAQTSYKFYCSSPCVCLTNNKSCASVYSFEVKLIVGRGGCATAGRELLSWALKTGVKRHQIKASFSTWSYTEPEERKLWGMPACPSSTKDPSPNPSLGSSIWNGWCCTRV